MKRSLQEVVELVVFGLVALLIGTGLLWVVGWLLSLGGLLLKAIAGLLWLLLRFVVPVAIVAGLVYFLVKALQGRHGSEPASGAGAASTAATTTATTPAPAAAAATSGAAPTVGAPGASSAEGAATDPSAAGDAGSVATENASEQTADPTTDPATDRAAGDAGNAANES
ncbi:MAG: hypothetical protein H3C53_11735 [Trueperaceae bacterium]|nr:hypothetical protein [Trueperaceae bacterium]